MILAASMFPPASGHYRAVAADKELSHPTFEVSVRDGLLTLQAVDAPLDDVLERIGEAAGIRVVLKRALDTPESWTITDVPLEKALRRLLGRRSYLITYEGGGDKRQLAELRVLRSTMAESGHGFEIGRTLTAAAKIDAQDELWVATPDDDRETRMNFVRNMAQRPEAAAVDGLGVLLSQDEDSMVRRIAAIGLGKTKGDAALAALTAASQDADASVRRRAIQGLGKKRDDRAVDALSAVLLEDPDTRMRRAAVHSLRKIGTKEAFEALHEGESDSDYYVRRDTGLALAQMRENGIDPEI